MSWKWADMAIQHHLRIKNWPVELKQSFPSEGFKLGSMSGRDINRAFKSMCDEMQKKYEGEEYDEETTCMVVSWTDEERAIDDLRDQADIPIVSCSDGTVLLSVDKSKKYLSKVMKTYTAGNRKKKSTKKTQSEDEDEDEDGNGAHPPNTQPGPSHRAVVRNAQAGPSGTKRSVDDDDAAAQAPAAKRRQLQVPAPSPPPPPPPPTAPSLLKCRCYVNPQLQFEFYASVIRATDGMADDHQRATQVYAEQMGRWVPLAPGMEAIPVDVGLHKTMHFAMGL
ncbi:hypothetical protein C8R44DRAFT_885380 [Mycena epipterygia]|nr:hypothetical protein C8R44DRAFT_885380 [Mycena epipterygia]